MEKPVNEACLRNQQAIYEALRLHFAGSRSVLEIGSGTGQHAVYMAEHMPWLEWQPSELAPALPGIELWRREAGLDNLRSPLELDVRCHPWPLDSLFDAAFSANTVHYVGWPLVEAMVEGLAQALEQGACFCLYGPFNREGRFTSEGNRALDSWLRERDPDSGIKDLAQMVERLEEAGFDYRGEQAMPANNLLLRFTRR
ncbi:DUF938 domain-containing protein [Aestuariirhabdus litorea]|uniref:DUF938 domain-containing protein n=1 Tax=Aestuariirhabdus litorea TaxID=2528527 RepID=A0A3P3VQZ1_9GAMM|nr:DUF938 domain-containing protein [Aestuariirhabdus litorea]RRJ84388.1 DUF938 domain-containing protein [Aestuariirhabdus litorea]RWW97612.1 DUF938 domain-containing protein [Endozoicomonadaceae bacterium GTF-13]